MAIRYLLKCQCGQPTPVTIAQAGETVTCGCGKKLQVPTLRGLRELEQETMPEPPHRGRAAWSPVQGYLYSAGILLAIGGIAFGAWQVVQYLRVKPYTVDQSVAVTESMNADVDDMQLMQTLDEWKHSLEHGLADDQTPEWIQAQKMSEGFRNSALIAFVIAGVGILGVAIAFVIRPGR